VLSCRRNDFSLPADLHYLNCAYLGPLSVEVEEAGVAGVRGRRDPTAFRPEHFFTLADEVRELFARLIGAPDPARIAILPAVSYGMAIAARNLSVSAGAEIVIAREQFPSNVLVWRRLAAERNATLREVVAPPHGSGRGEGWNRAILEAIGPKTAVVALGTVHWTDGTRFDLEAIGARAREVGAALVVDGTQSVGAVPFDVGTVQPDLLVCAAYKWLLGPYGVALAYVGERLLDGVPLEETWISRVGSDDFSSLVDPGDRYRDGAVRFDVGERSNPVLLPMAAAALRQLLRWEVAEISARCAALLAPAVRALADHGYTTDDDAWRSPHLVGVRVPDGVEPGAMREALQRARVAVSIRGAAVRISPNVYNDEADMDALITTMRGR
jgi:selenocysteine lyase/cysteine desulfurase